MKICLVAMNSSYVHSSLALHSIYSNIKTAKEDVYIAEYNINMQIRDIICDLVNKSCDIYLFSCYIWNVETVKKVASTIKQATNATIVLGGSEVSYNKKEILDECSYVDYILSGWGEISVNELINMKKGLKYDGSLISTREHIQENRACDIDMDTLSFSYTDEYLNENKNKILYYESSRGCPFGCSFCLSSIDKTLRYKSLEKVKTELGIFLRHNVKLVKFVDRTFNSDNKRALEIVKFIKENDNGITSFHFEIMPDILREDFIEELVTARANLFQIECGLQSINKETLNAIGRKNNEAKIQEVFFRLHENKGLHTHVDLIAGLPFETYETFARGFDFVFSLKASMVQLGFLKVLHGTKIESEKENYGILTESFPPYQVIKTSTMTFTELSVLDEIASIVDRFYNTKSFSNTFHYIEENENSMFRFFESFNYYLNDKKIKLSNMSKENLYPVFAEFLNLHYHHDVLSFLVSLDFALFSKSKASLNISTSFTQAKGSDVFEFLKKEENIRKYFPQYNSMKPKDIFKKSRFFHCGYSLSDSLQPQKEDCVAMLKDSAQEAIFISQSEFFAMQE